MDSTKERRKSLLFQIHKNTRFCACVYCTKSSPLMTKFLNLIKPLMRNSSFWFIIALTLLISFACEVYNNYKKIFKLNKYNLSNFI